jgi:hypothetical protein
LSGRLAIWRSPTTAALALIVGGLSGSAVLAMLMLVAALAVHVHLRRQ